jgi:uncharacterized membrane protein YbhN (UPF0104 family)
MIDWWNRNRQTLARLVGTCLAIILIIILLEEEGGADILTAMKRISVAHFLMAGMIMVISRLFVAGRWHVLLRSGGMEISPTRTTMLTFTGLFSSNFLPTTIGGDVVRLAGTMQFGYDRAICLASLVADRLIGMAGMAVTLPLGLAPILSLGANGVEAFAVSGLFQKTIDFSRRTFGAFSIWFQKPFALLFSFLSTFGNMLCIFAAVYILILGMDRHVSYWLIAGLWSVTYFVTLVPVSVNGYGVQELSLTFLLSRLGGLSHSESLTVAILIRALFMITSLPGAFFLPSILAVMSGAKEKNIL